MGLTRTLKFRLSDETYEAIRRAAESERRKTSDLMRLIVDDWLADYNPTH